ncbi:MAG: hypothetical protein NPIRA02_31740 [Nitrospirales bacterium]|nr:MAG: hypothetical protein NPIRA02_31740 [Nitrospirales bacterium]
MAINMVLIGAMLNYDHTRSLSCEDKKLTLEVPQELLERATKATGKGITPTIRKRLELVAASGAYAKLRLLKGKVKFSINLSDLRED